MHDHTFLFSEIVIPEQMEQAMDGTECHLINNGVMKFAEGKAQRAAQPCGSKVPFNGSGEPEFKALQKF